MSSAQSATKAISGCRGRARRKLDGAAQSDLPVKKRAITAGVRSALKEAFGQPEPSLGASTASIVSEGGDQICMPPKPASELRPNLTTKNLMRVPKQHCISRPRF